MPIKAVGQSAASEDFLELSYSYRILNVIGQIPNFLKFERNSCCLVMIIIVVYKKDVANVKVILL